MKTKSSTARVQNDGEVRASRLPPGFRRLSRFESVWHHACFFSLSRLAFPLAFPADSKHTHTRTHWSERDASDISLSGTELVDHPGHRFALALAVAPSFGASPARVWELFRSADTPGPHGFCLFQQVVLSLCQRYFVAVLCGHRFSFASSIPPHSDLFNFEKYRSAITVCQGEEGVM